jgi:hypothetical protein
MKDIDNKVLLKKVIVVLMDYVLIHILWIIITVFTAFLLYTLEYGKTESSLDILKSIISNTSGMIVMLTILAIYPTIWVFAYSIVVNSELSRIFVFSLISLTIGIIIVKLFLGFDLFFDFRYGAFPILVGFLISPLIYLTIKKRVVTQCIKHS